MRLSLGRQSTVVTLRHQRTRQICRRHRYCAVAVIFTLLVNTSFRANDCGRMVLNSGLQRIHETTSTTAQILTEPMKSARIFTISETILKVAKYIRHSKLFFVVSLYMGITKMCLINLQQVTDQSGSSGRLLLSKSINTQNQLVKQATGRTDI